MRASPYFTHRRPASGDELDDPMVRARMWREIEEAESSRIARLVKQAIEQRARLEAAEERCSLLETV